MVHALRLPNDPAAWDAFVANKSVQEAMLVSEPLRVKGILGTMMSNWGATMGMYDYRNVLGASRTS